MATEIQPRPPEVAPTRLWFGLLAAALSWFGLGIADVLITWRACLHEEQYGGPSEHAGLTALNIALFAALLLIAIVAGIVSYTNWKRLSQQNRIVTAEATASREFMAMVGVFISVTLGLGIVWLGIPLLILQLCLRIR
ncbi:MAG TPA: hypothetical protein VJ728_04210 [Candidatus Binataceae bacterium]|nr:hypothetical protein [Candidatus Binataceae bacterium]